MSQTLDTFLDGLGLDMYVEEFMQNGVGDLDDLQIVTEQSELLQLCPSLQTNPMAQIKIMKALKSTHLVQGPRSIALGSHAPHFTILSPSYGGLKACGWRLHLFVLLMSVLKYGVVPLDKTELSVLLQLIWATTCISNETLYIGQGDTKVLEWILKRLFPQMLRQVRFKGFKMKLTQMYQNIRGNLIKGLQIPNVECAAFRELLDRYPDKAHNLVESVDDLVQEDWEMHQDAIAAVIAGSANDEKQGMRAHIKVIQQAIQDHKSFFDEDTSKHFFKGLQDSWDDADKKAEAARQAQARAEAAEAAAAKGFFSPPQAPPQKPPQAPPQMPPVAPAASQATNLQFAPHTVKPPSTFRPRAAATQPDIAEEELEFLQDNIIAQVQPPKKRLHRVDEVQPEVAPCKHCECTVEKKKMKEHLKTCPKKPPPQPKKRKNSATDKASAATQPKQKRGRAAAQPPAPEPQAAQPPAPEPQAAQPPATEPQAAQPPATEPTYRSPSGWYAEWSAATASGSGRQTTAAATASGDGSSADSGESQQQQAPAQQQIPHTAATNQPADSSSDDEDTPLVDLMREGAATGKAAEAAQPPAPEPQAAQPPVAEPPAAAPAVEEEEKEDEIDEVLSCGTHRGKVQCLCSWKGYTKELENLTWQALGSMSGFKGGKAAVKKYQDWAKGCTPPLWPPKAKSCINPALYAVDYSPVLP